MLFIGLEFNGLVVATFRQAPIAHRLRGPNTPGVPGSLPRFARDFAANYAWSYKSGFRFVLVCDGCPPKRQGNYRISSVPRRSTPALHNVTIHCVVQR